VLLHVLILLLLRYLVPEAELGPGERERSPAFRVRLEPRRPSGLVERGGALEATRSAELESAEPQRVELARDETADAPAAIAALERAEPEPALAPEPGELELEPTSSLAPSPEIATPREERARLRAEASELALGAPDAASPARRATPAPSSGPVAVSVESERTVDDQPSSRPVARGTAPAEVADAPLPPGDVAPASGATQQRAGPAVALPNEPRPRLEGGTASAPELDARSFDAQRSGAGSAEGGSGPERAAVAAEVPRGSPDDAPPAPPSLARRGASEPDAPARAYEPSSAAPSQAGRPEASGPPVALPSEGIERASLGAPDVLRETLEPVAIAPRRSAEAGGGPGARLPAAALPAAAAPGLDAPAARPLAAAPRSGADELPQTPPRLDDTPYRSRFGTEKEIALREHGGTAETERAVAAGLRYLASKQRGDGSWGSPEDRSDKYRDVRVGKTALALLAFLGAGHTQASGTEHSATAARAIDWLLAVQDEATGHFGDSEAYSHGIATYALAEDYAITRDARIRPAVERAVAQILRQQLTRGDERRVGGWSYYYPDGAIFDSWPRTSITSWQVMALESARLGGLDVPDEAFARARDFLLAAWDADMGRFRYNHAPERLRQAYRTLPGSTPAALFALSLLGEELAGERWRTAVEFLSSCAPSGYRWEGEQAFVERAQGNLYFWYYGSLALLRHGGAEWERWNAALKEALPPAQAPDGSWQPIDVYCEYAGDDEDDRIYSTAMCVLALEVYYRYFTPLLRVDARR
jgi:hypothetical protein